MDDNATWKTVKFNVHVERKIGHLQLSRPDKMNAFTQAMAGEIVAVVRAAEQDPRVAVLVVSGDPAGRAFCAGSDLSPDDEAVSAAASLSDTAMREQCGVAAARAWRDTGGQVALALLRCRKPIVAAINGSAVGIGITMALAMDVRVVARDAKIGFVFGRRGIVMEACSSVLLQRIVPRGKAMEWTLTGRVFPASEAAGSGLFNEIVADPAAVLDRAFAIADDIAAHVSPVSAALMKDLQLVGITATPEQAHLYESQALQHCFTSSDSAEGIASFLERRPPVFPSDAWRDLPVCYPFSPSPVHGYPAARL